MADGCHVENDYIAISAKNHAILMQQQIWNSMTVT